MEYFDSTFGYEANPAYASILRLHETLTERNIEHTLNRCWDGWQIRFPDGGDLVEHNGSYGHWSDLMESMGMPWDGDDVTGYLSVADVLNRLGL